MSQAVADLPTEITVLPRALFTAVEVATALSVSTTFVRQLTIDGVIPCRRIGRLVRYAQEDIDAFIGARDERAY